jgi:hypothetical protein
MMRVLQTAEWSLREALLRAVLAHQLCPSLMHCLSLTQLQKAAEPWVLKHADLEKQDNSWKEVRMSLPPCSLDSWVG